MRWRLLAVVAGLVLCHGFETVRAQTGCTEWYDDCPQSGWQGPGMLLATLTGPCDVEIDYRWRDNCGFQDFELVAIRFVSGDCSGFDNNATFVQMVREAVFQMVLQNPMNFPPRAEQRNTCISTYRSYLSNCWGRYRNEADGPPYARPCANNCCRNRFEVCTDDEGNRSISQYFDTMVFGPNTCEHAALPNELSCVSVCNAE